MKDKAPKTARTDVASLRRKALANLIKTEGIRKLTDETLGLVFGISQRAVTYLRTEVGLPPAFRR